MTKQRSNVTAFDSMLANPDDLTKLGMAIGAGMQQAQQNRQGLMLPNAMMFKESQTDLVPKTVSIYGRYSIFDCCSPGDVFGLQVQTVGLMQWLGWRPNRFYRRRVDFIPWYGPEGVVACTNRTGAGNPCDDPKGWEYQVCGYDLQHTSWYHRQGDPLNPHTIVQDRCETTPRYRLNGIMISDDVEWQMNGIMNVLQQDIRRDLIHGNHSNAFQMDGLESLIKTGYTNDNGTTCPQIDSTVVDWAHDDLDGAVNGFGNFFDYLDEVVTEKEWRASAVGTISETDMVLLTSRFMATCLLDAYACYTTCGVTDTNDVTDQALRAQQRQARFNLNGGPLYDGAAAVGFINLKSGRRLPIIVDDAMDIEKGGAGYCTDIYLLTRRIGSIDVLYGEYLDLRVFENRVRAKFPDASYRADAAGRFVAKGKEDNWCTVFMMGTSPEIYLSAPWAQTRFQDVCCSRKRTPFTGDPGQKFYWPGGKPAHRAWFDVDTSQTLR
jgi:hypothetical protein